MVQTENLRTASLYINNQLLSRGLLSDGQSIDFADPGRDEELGETMGRIIGVVNDLILRRDRDAEHRESLSTTLRTVRAESLRQTNDLQRLQEKHADAQRKLSINDAAEVALRTQLKSAEAGIRALKDEAARTKVLVAQTRAACANEVRKRDRQIDGLKKAVADAGRARGERKAGGITSIVVTGDVGAEGSEASSLSSFSPSRGGGAGGTDDDEYDLRMETNSFLAELARGLSEENETLLGLVRKTAGRLKDMSGFPGEQQPGDGLAVSLTASPDELDSEMDAILEHLRTILTNPSFVPIEEVVVRDDEIHRLRDGWVKMEARWKEAVHLLDGWRKRMAVSGRSVNMEELKMGLRLSPVRVTDVEETTQGGLGLRLSTLQEEQDEVEGLEGEDEAEEDDRAVMARIAAQSPCPAESLQLVAAPEYLDPEDSDSESSIFEDDVDLHELDVEEPNVQILEQSMMIHSVDVIPLPPSNPPLPPPLRDSDSAGNRRAAAAAAPPPPSAASHAAAARGRKRPGHNDFTTIVEENTKVLAKAAATPLPSAAATAPKRTRSPQKQAKPAAVAKENIRPTSAASHVSTASTDSIQLVKSSQPSPGTTTTTTTTTSNTAIAVAPPPTAARPTQSSSLKQRQQAAQHDPSPRQQPQRGSAKVNITTQKEDSVSPQSKLPPSSSTDMPPPPLPTPNHPRSRSPAKPSSRLPLPRPGATTALPPPAAAAAQQPPPQSPLTTATIAAKLAASEREADAARVRAKLKAARLGKRANPPLPSSSTTSTIRTVSGASSVDPAADSSLPDSGAAASLDPVKKPLPPPSFDEEDELAGPGPVPDAIVGPAKRKRDPTRRASKVASRRRSTLNPWELESLIAGSVGPA